MFSINLTNLCKELKLISEESNTTATRAREICASLITKKAMLQLTNQELTKIMIAKKVTHCFFVNRNFNFQLDDEDEYLWNDNALLIRYTFRCRPEYEYRVQFNYFEGDNHVLVILQRLLDGEVQDSSCTLKPLPLELSQDSIMNDEYQIEKMLLLLTKKFSPLWNRFGGSTASPDQLPLLQVDD